MLDELLDRPAELLFVLVVEVDLVVSAVNTEADGVGGIGLAKKKREPRPAKALRIEP